MANISKCLGYKVIIITARPNFIENRTYTENQLKLHNINYDLIFYTTHLNKKYIKKKLINTFVLSVGDMWTDLTDSLHYIKLPSSFYNETKCYSA